MQVFDILKEAEKVAVKEEVIQPSVDKDAFAQKYFKAESFDYFMQHYIKESKDVIKSYNNFMRSYGYHSLPESTQVELAKIKKSIKFAQSYYRSYNMNESAVELNDDIQIALRHTWGNYPMYVEYLDTLNKDFARLAK